MKRIHVFTLGGTIAYTGEDGNLILGGDDLIRQIPEISNIAKVYTTSYLQKASSALTINNIIELSYEIKQKIKAGFDGIVVTQGTDTMEETAFILDLLINSNIPIVITGAMRDQSMLGADGPANLVAAIQVAANDRCRDIGTVVVMNDEIHSAKFVRKDHTHNVNSFKSEFGPIGFISENRPQIIMRTTIKNGITFNEIIEDVSVLLYTVAMGDDGRLLKKAKELGYGGIVLEALGGGHVPTEMVGTLEQIAKEIPVILASRTGGGAMLTNTYHGYPGSETSLLAKGLISAGLLDARKARILLHLLLMSDKTNEEIGTYFT